MGEFGVLFLKQCAGCGVYVPFLHVKLLFLDIRAVLYKKNPTHKNYEEISFWYTTTGFVNLNWNDCEPHQTNNNNNKIWLTHFWHIDNGSLFPFILSFSCSKTTWNIISYGFLFNFTSNTVYGTYGFIDPSGLYSTRK